VSFEPHPVGGPGPGNPPGYPAPGWPTPPGGPPGYGSGPPAGSPPPTFPPPRATSERRPRKFWYAIGAGLVAIGLLGGVIGVIAVFAGGLTHLTAGAPTADHEFVGHGTTTVHIDAGASKTIYANMSTPQSGTTCTARGTQGERKPTLTPYSSNFTVNQWRAMFTLTVQDGGDYSISCSGPPNAGYGVGEHISGSQFADSFVGLFVVGGISGAVVIAGIVVLVVTGFRRSRSTPQPPLPNQPQQWPGRQ
jgi:hypothetical protein